MASGFGPDQAIPMVGVLGAMGALVMLFWDSIWKRLRRVSTAPRR